MIVVVTGASAGVGRATAREFAAHGWHVALLARNAARLASAADEIRRYGVKALTITADVADAEAVDAAATRVETELGPIDAWVNNAMASVFSPVVSVTPQEFRRGTEVTYLGQVYGTMTALKRMRARGAPSSILAPLFRTGRSHCNPSTAAPNTRSAGSPMRCARS
jgi:NAD(P)-dependent dehydrogenase (short-subunit alcohol dehydrogenase family)